MTNVDLATNMAFSMQIYADDPSVSPTTLFDKAKVLKAALEKLPSVESVNFGAGSAVGVNVGAAPDDSAYEVHIIVSEDALTSRGLTLAGISSAIQSYNVNQPIGTFTIDGMSYDYRIEGKNKTSFDFLQTPINLPGGGTILL